MRQPSHNLSPTTTVLLSLLLVVAFFPGAFHYIWTLPFSLLPIIFPHLAPSPTAPPPLDDSPGNMAWVQKQFTLPSKSRGSYLVTDSVVSSVPEIKDFKVGLLNLFVQHTSCALSLNENCLHRVPI